MIIDPKMQMAFEKLMETLVNENHTLYLAEVLCRRNNLDLELTYSLIPGEWFCKLKQGEKTVSATNNMNPYNAVIHAAAKAMFMDHIKPKESVKKKG